MEQQTIALPFVGLSKQKLSARAVSVLTEAIESGNVLPVAEGVAALEQFVKQVKEAPEYEAFRDAVRTAASKQITTASGAKIESCETGTKYDYSQCGDPELLDLLAQFKVIAEKVEERKDFLKMVPAAGIDVFDAESGDTWKIYPPSKSSTSSYKVTLKSGK